MTYILLTIAALIAHQMLLKWEYYRWLANSVIYPINKRRIKNKIKRMRFRDLVDYWHEFQLVEYWFKKYWFGKKLMKIIDDELLKRNNELKQDIL